MTKNKILNVSSDNMEFSILESSITHFIYDKSNNMSIIYLVGSKDLSASGRELYDICYKFFENN